MSDIYLDNMSRHMTESYRLDEQFDLLSKNVGYILHPKIVSRLPDSAVIADVGTGTGKFLLTLAKEWPAATLRGFDISSALFPSQDDIPGNIRLGLMNIKQIPPEEEQGRYDVVNLRLLAAAMEPEDWAKAVSNVAMLLKPGGAIQWTEPNFADARHLRGATTSSTSAARSMGILFRDALKDLFSHGWNTLPDIMQHDNFEEIEEDIVSSDRFPETRKAMTANGMLAIFDWARRMSRRGVPESKSIEELNALERQVDDDIQSGCYVRFDIHTILGFKPSM